jgi:hypothetical protein
MTPNCKNGPNLSDFRLEQERGDFVAARILVSGQLKSVSVL